jgi:threonine dehydratase
MMAKASINLAAIEAACVRIGSTIHRTRMEQSASLTQTTGVPVHLKLEHQQRTGSFKLRGATNAILSLSEDERARGVVGVSTGNHGRGLAYAARQNGVRCIVAMSELVPQNKIDGIKAQGAEVRIVGQSQDDAQVEVDRLVIEEGMTMIPPFDHAGIIAGQGTLGLELAEDLPELSTVLVQLSGGGLISGVAAALKTRLPDVQVIGVSMERGAAMYGLDNAYTFAMTRELVDDIVLVTEAEIAAGIRHAYWQEHQIIEGSGAVGIAALLAGKVRPKGLTAVLLSGGNIDMGLHHRIVSGEDVDVTAEV